MMSIKDDLTKEEEEQSKFIVKIANEIQRILIEGTDGNIVSMIGLLELVKANILETAKLNK